MHDLTMIRSHERANVSPKRRRNVARLLLLVSLLGLAAVPWFLLGQSGLSSEASHPGAQATGLVDLQVIATGFTEVTDIQFVPAAARLAIVLQKNGTARLVDLPLPGARVSADSAPVVFRVDVRTESELGLLGLAFHPNYVKNGLFYVNYTPTGGTRRSVVAEWRLPAVELGRKRAREVRRILEVEQPYSNHDAGQLVFGPDAMLYVGFGDGGSADDPKGHGQNTKTLLGSMIRIDVDRRDAGKAYAVPKDNPFVRKSGVLPEIWAYGLRNPWRYTFDPAGRLIVADVGQDRYEEIDIVERGNNLGWNRREGRHCFEPPKGCSTKGLTDPIFEYGRDLGQSVTGGYVYTGKSIPALRGKYIFADYLSGRLWALALPKKSAAEPGCCKAQELGRFARAIATFGRDPGGELYAGDFASGDLLRLVAR